MNTNINRAIRGLICLSMLFTFSVAIPTAVPGVAEAEAVQPRSSVDRRLRPGGGYFASSPQNRARTSQPAAVARPVAPMVQPGTAIVRTPQVQPGQIVSRPLVQQQGIVMGQPPQVVYPQGTIVHQQPQVIHQQPLATPPTRWVTTPQR
jgi:hypothetical protein